MNIIERQKQLEADSVIEGLTRYHEQIHRALPRSQQDTEVLQRVIGPLAESIRREQEHVVLARTKMPKYAIPLLSLDADRLALITLQSILYLAATRGGEFPTPVKEAARFIARQCYLERCYDQVLGRARDVCKLLLSRNKDPSNARKRSREQAAIADAGDWTKGYRDISLGTKLLELATKHTNLLEVEKVVKRHRGRFQTLGVIHLSEDIQESLALPIYLPMTEKPNQWTGLRGGGYPTIPDLELVKHHDNKRIRDALEAAHEAAQLGPVFAAVNALQETPWRINKRLYSIMRSAWEEGRTVGGIPARYQRHQSSKPTQDMPKVPTEEAKEVVLSARKSSRLSDRVFAGLFQALEKHTTLDSMVVAKRTTQSLGLEHEEFATQAGSSGSGLRRSREGSRKALRDLVEYYLYRGLRPGWGLTFLHLEQLGLARIEYSGLPEICNKDELWLDSVLLRESSRERRQYIATVLLNYMRRNLAITAKSLSGKAQQSLRRRVRRNLKKPWVFGKRERLRQCTVFVNPEMSAEYRINERSLSARSRVGLFLRKGEHWGRPGKLTTREYNLLIKALLQALQKGGLLVGVRSAQGQPGFQICVERLCWVLGDGSAPPDDPLSPRPRRRVHDDKEAAAARTMMQMRMHICEKLVHEEHFYFPYQLDYRGRAYPVPQVINPQSHDIGRALIEFADDKPLGERGAYWLAVHLANKFGYDKASFDERVKWVEDNEDEIRDSAQNPLGGRRFWEKAEKPWCFLAACLEWEEYCKEGRNPNFKSHLPIAMDGTCNGLQHLSAMGRDPQGGMATNLLPCKSPEDIYQRVADRLIACLQAEAKCGKQEARTWLDWLKKRKETDPGIERRLVKRATMTTPYGITPYGIREQLIEDGFTAQLEEDKWVTTDDPRRALEEWIWPGKRRHQTFVTTNYLRDRLKRCIGEVVVKAREIEAKLQRLATRLAEADRGISWITPTGFPVVVEHREYKKRRIVTALGNLEVDDTTSPLKLQRNKQQSTIVPNFIHSFDAAHMMLTVNRLYEEGRHHFAMVHDSYGVHACDVDLMNRILREEFIHIYREPVMAQFWTRQREANADIDLPEPPSTGNLDVEAVKHSAYFFS